MVLGKIWLATLFGLVLVYSAPAEVRVFLQDSNGVAWLQYECTAGEVVRAFALDVSVDRGQITGIAGYFRGESKPGSRGYGIFPASLRDHLLAGGTTNLDWNATSYSPLAAVSDAPETTLPGLNSTGVTLEFGGMWDPTVSGAVPASAGTLCALSLSQPATVSVAANASRGGIVSAFSETPIEPIFTGIEVRPFLIGTDVHDGYITVRFGGGELETAARIEGPWVGTSDFSGNYTEATGTNQMRFYRVRSP